MQSGLLSAQRIFTRMRQRECVFLCANTENYKMNEKLTAESPFANSWIQLTGLAAAGAAPIQVEALPRVTHLEIVWPL
ncbi:MAG: hypothetical protein ABI356_03705 [Steroidobacteraceae bacterium]